ncbi:MAG: hypothetical protein ABRQ26_06810 [Syntrophomonadaceae bacterium]
MPRIIISAYRDSENSVHNFEVPSDIPSGILARILAKNMGWDIAAGGRKQSYRIEAHPPGRPLNQRETLEQAGATDGASILFIPTVSQEHEACTENLDTGTLQKYMQGQTPEVRPARNDIPVQVSVQPPIQTPVQSPTPPPVQTPVQPPVQVQQPAAAAPAAPYPTGFTPLGDIPGSSWQPQGVPEAGPQPDSETAPPSQQQEGYVWKQLD